MIEACAEAPSPSELKNQQCGAVAPYLVEARNAAPFPVEPRFVVAYGRRCGSRTRDAFSMPEHYTRGASALANTDETDEFDETRSGREVRSARTP